MKYVVLQTETPKSHMETTPQTSTALDDVDTQWVKYIK